MKRIVSILLALVTVLTVLCVPAFAAHKQVTPDMKVSEMIAIPEFKENDIGTSNKDVVQSFQNLQTVGQCAGEGAEQNACNALNKIADNYDKGIQVRYKIYTEEERKADPTKENVDLYYYPAAKKNQKFIVVCPGGGYLFTTILGEGYDVANQFNDLGYNAFVLKYRTGKDAKSNAPIQDLARAVQFIQSNAQKFELDPNDYAVAGFSAGGHLVAEYGTDRWGYKKYNLSKPAVIMAVYPLICTEKIDKIFEQILGEDNLCVEKQITPDYPNVYLVEGKDDYLLDYKQHAVAYDEALTRNNVPHVFKLYDHVEHGSGAGAGSDDYGWIQDAAGYWESVVK